MIYNSTDSSLPPIGTIESKSVTMPLLAVRAGLLLIFLFLAFRLFNLQIVYGSFYEGKAKGNRIIQRVTEASRGMILDSSGNWLAKNEPSFALTVTPADLPIKKADRESTISQIAEISGLSVEDIIKAIDKAGSRALSAVILKENISHDEALLLEGKVTNVTSLSVANRPLREYRQFPGLAHLLGYTGIVSADDLEKSSVYTATARVGKTGIESVYEEYLRGQNGIEEVEVDSGRNVIKTLVTPDNSEPIPGNDIVLNIDSALQQKTAEALNKGIEAGRELTGSKLSGGSAIVMDVNSGAILSMVSLPDYNNNLFSTRISNDDYRKLAEDESYPMFDRAIAGVYPPGSIVKIVLAAAGLVEGNITLNTAFDTPAEIKIGDYTFPDWKDHGLTDIKRAIAESNNIFFYSIGGGFDKIKGLGIDKIKQYWQLFGLGGKTGIDLTGEESGLLPDASWKKRVFDQQWYIGDTYHAAIGQGDLLVTPIQMLVATAAIANGGKVMTPQIAQKIIGKDGKSISEFKPKIRRENLLPSFALKAVQDGMRMAITEGSARNLNDLPFSVAGKTGTAQFLNNQKTHAWFTCYAPYEKPEIAVIVLVEGGGGGHEIAAPVAKEILSAYFKQ
ncbi:MAG: penicillin-binding protein 2 [Patescibacteria group bacterium]